MIKQKKWLGRQDSNLRMPGSKPGALPLGDAPTLKLLSQQIFFYHTQQIKLDKYD